MDHAPRSPRGVGFVRLGKDVAMTRLPALLLIFAGLTAVTTGALAAWKTEPGVATPSYAVTQPDTSTLNVDSVVLMCEPSGEPTPVLQLQLYLTDDGPLQPKGAAAEALKAEPRAELAIDGQVFPVGLYFAEDHVVVADDAQDAMPRLSGRLLDALQNGHRLVLRADLLAEPAGQPAAFDGTLEVALAGKAIAAVRRCATAPALSLATH